MKCRMLSVVFALAALPALAQVPEDGLLVKTRDLELAVSEIADWSQFQEMLDDIVSINTVRLCQKRTSKADPQKCYYMYWAKGRHGRPGYVAPMAQMGDVAWDSLSNVDKWYRVNRKWNRRLINRLMVWAPIEYYATGPSSPQGCAYRNGGTQDFPYWDGTC